MKKFLLAFFLVLSFFKSFSQDFKEGMIALADLDQKIYAKDTSASAVVLREYGNAFITTSETTELFFEYHVKIKIFNTKGFEKGNIEIPLYKSSSESFEKVSNISGWTYNLNESGGLEKTSFDPKQVFKENKNKRWDVAKFAMPNIRNGSIIEYSYRIVSPFIFNFRTWTFQSDIPKVKSEYVAHIPAVFNYNVSLKGYLSLSEKPKMEVENGCFIVGSLKTDCSRITYVMNDIPALVEEEYMTAPVNYRSAINFELSDYMDYRGAKHTVTKDWKVIDYDLKKDESFGSQIKKKDLFEERLAPVLANVTDELSKAKAIYNYIQHQFKWNNFVGIFSDGIKKPLENRTGSVADINLSLIAALSSAGLNVESVLLSTRDNGIINKLFPVVSDFNYVVAKVNIADKSYLLDATDPLLPFGLLPVKCINDQGRVISLDKASYWLDLKAAQSESKIYSLNLTLHPDGKLKGTISTFSRGYEAYNRRKAIKKFNSIEEYVENWDESLPKLKVLNYTITNVDSLDKVVGETYEVEINAYDALNKEKFLFNPFIMEKQTENPFKLAERTYPVDLGAASETIVTLTLNFPADYKIETIPADNALSLPLNGGKFISKSEIGEDHLTFTQQIQLAKPIYSAQEYPYLKEFFNKIVQSEKSDFIFAKKP